MMLTTAVFLSLAALAQGPRHGDPAPRPPARARVLKSLSVREIFGAARMPLAPPLGSFLGIIEQGNNPGGSLLRASEENQLLLPGDRLVDLVRILTPIDWDSTEISIELQGSALLISGAPDKVHLAEATVKQLAAALIQRIELRAVLYRLPRSRPDLPAVVDAGRLAQVTQGLQAVWRGRTICRSGNVAALARERLARYVRDVDVEVAQRAFIGDPKTALAFEGIRVLAEPHVLTASKDLVVFAQFAFGERHGPFKNRSTGIEKLPSIEVPDLSVSSGSFSGRVRDGGALLLSVRGAPEVGENMLLALSAHSLTPRPQAAQDAVFLPASALITKALRRKTRLAYSEQGRLDPTQFDIEQEAKVTQGPSDPHALLELVRQTTGIGEGEKDFLEYAGGQLIVRSTEPMRAAVTTLLRGLQDQWLRTVTIELRTRLGGAAQEDTVFPASSQGAPGSAETAKLLQAVTFPALLGRSHVIHKGRETTAQDEIEVEIAQRAMISNPVVTNIYSGLLLAVLPYATLDGLGTKLELAVFHTPEPLRRPSETKEGGDLYLPRIGVCTFRRNGGILADTEIVLGEGPIVKLRQKSYRTQQTMRMRER